MGKKKIWDFLFFNSFVREYVFKDYDEDEVKLKIAQKQSNPLKILIFVKKPKFKMRSSVNAEISVKLFFY